MKEDISRNYIEKTKPGSFKYGSNDCAMWVFKYVKSLNGIDFLSKLMNKYKTWSEGRELLRSMGHKNLKEFLDKQIKTIPVSYAQRGDLVMCRGALGICQGKFSYFLNKKNVTHLVTLDCKFAWRVEEKCLK